jgi:hypothetical protein
MQIRDESITIVLLRLCNCEIALLSVAAQKQHHSRRVELHFDDVAFFECEYALFAVHCRIRVRISVSVAAVGIIAVSEFLTIHWYKVIGAENVLRRHSQTYDISHFDDSDSAPVSRARHRSV